MNSTVVITKSEITGQGLFAARNIKKGEVIIKWHPKILAAGDVVAVPDEEQHYVCKTDNQYFLMQPPERFMNHSCEPNTQVIDHCDVAIRDITEGEELTSDYEGCGLLSFNCKCGSKECRGKVN